MVAPWPSRRSALIGLPRLGPRAASLLVTAALGLAVVLALNLAIFRVSNALVSGNVRVASEEIESALGASGTSIFLMRPNELAAQLRTSFPELASAQVRVYLPNRVWARVTERTPVIQWQTGESYAWIDSSGVAFRPRGEVPGLITVEAASTPPKPIGPGDDPLSPPPFLTHELVDAILTLAPNVPAGSVLTYSTESGLGWEDPRGWKVAFGASKAEMPLRLRVYQSLADSLVARGQYPAFISVVYPDAPFYRMAGAGEDCSESDTTCLTPSG